jgi:hypothetical protein
MVLYCCSSVLLIHCCCCICFQAQVVPLLCYASGLVCSVGSVRPVTSVDPRKGSWTLQVGSVSQSRGDLNGMIIVLLKQGPVICCCYVQYTANYSISCNASAVSSCWALCVVLLLARCGR